MALGSPLRENARIPERAEDFTPLILGNQVTEAIQVTRYLFLLVPEADDIHRRIGNPGQQLCELGIKRCGQFLEDMSRSCRHHDFGIDRGPIGQAQLPAAIDRFHPGDRAAGHHPAFQVFHRCIRQFLNPADKRCQDATRARSAGDLLTGLDLCPLLLRQLEHGLNQATELLLELVNTRETALQAHGLRVAGKDAGDHRPDQFVKRFGPQPAPGKFRQGLIDTVGALGFEKLLGQANLPRPADQFRL